MFSLPTTARCTSCNVERRVTGTLGAGDGANHLTLGTCGHVVPRDEARLACEVTVGWVANNHGYPYRATCSCGWESPTYVATHAARGMADWHLAGGERV